MPLIGKPLAVIGDARFGDMKDSSVVAERLLSISGNDSLTIDRKFLSPWTGCLPTRILLISNEMPGIKDGSGALASRFIMLKTATSFLGREDPTLFDRLATDLPGILNWAILGWRRLANRGHFIQPRASEEAIAELRALSSPILAFIDDECEVGPGKQIQAKTLLDAWLRWSQENGHLSVSTPQSFGRDLRAAVPGIGITQIRNSRRERVYIGICLLKT
jgi:putative DNA primase/helicase